MDDKKRDLLRKAGMGEDLVSQLHQRDEELERLGITNDIIDGVINRLGVSFEADKQYQAGLKKKGHGELFREMQRLYDADPNVLKQYEDIPIQSSDNHLRYNMIVSELNRREQPWYKRIFSF